MPDFGRVRNEIKDKANVDGGTNGEELIPGYHGPLSSYREWHAFTIGIYEGMKDLVPDGMDEKSRKNPDVEAEWHYACGGYTIGALIRIIIVLLVGGWFL